MAYIVHVGASLCILANRIILNNAEQIFPTFFFVRTSLFKMYRLKFVLLFGMTKSYCR